METETPLRSSSMERHLQTLIVFVLTGLLVWVGATVQKTQLEVVKLSVELNFLKEKLTEDNGKMTSIERRLDSIERELSRLSEQKQ